MRRRWLILLIAILIPICGCAGYGVYVRVGQHDFAEALTRAGLEPTDSAMVSYIEQSVSVGMTREQVEEALGILMPVRVARRGTPEDRPFNTERTSCDELLLVYGRLPGQNYTLIPCYAADGGLLRAQFSGLDAPHLRIR